MIRVFVGAAPKWESHEPILEHSIRRNTESDVEVTFMRAGENGLKPSGCTGFSKFRYEVPRLAGHEGFAIYLDIDMLVLGDIAELWDYRQTGRWICMQDGSTEVMVIDCSQARRQLRYWIPPEWNVEDRVEPGMKLLHFTDLKQDWLRGSHSCREALEILHEYKNDYAARSRMAVA